MISLSTLLLFLFWSAHAGQVQVDPDLQDFQLLLSGRELQSNNCGCSPTDAVLTGGCETSLFRRNETAWCDRAGDISYCCASYEADCCGITPAGKAFVAFFWISVIGGIAFCSCACCKICPFYEYLCCVSCCGPKDTAQSTLASATTIEAPTNQCTVQDDQETGLEMDKQSYQA